MTELKSVSITHFSDVLCVWGYIAQRRIDELKIEFGDNVDLQYHFIPIFASVEAKMQQNWAHRGGIAAYAKMVSDLAAEFDHIEVHDDIWVKNTPTSSASCHLFLKAAQLADEKGEMPVLSGNSTVLESIAWEMRLAFFKDLVNVSELSAQLDIAEKLGLPIDKIQTEISSGAAFAALDLDVQLKEKHRVAGSPSMVFNEGRQMIYGNVGYRVIQANVHELLNQPKVASSWC